MGGKRGQLPTAAHTMSTTTRRRRIGLAPSFIFPPLSCRLISLLNPQHSSASQTPKLLSLLNPQNSSASQAPKFLSLLKNSRKANETEATPCSARKVVPANRSGRRNWCSHSSTGTCTGCRELQERGSPISSRWSARITSLSACFTVRGGGLAQQACGFSVPLANCLPAHSTLRSWTPNCLPLKVNGSSFPSTPLSLSLHPPPLCLYREDSGARELATAASSNAICSKFYPNVQHFFFSSFLLPCSSQASPVLSEGAHGKLPRWRKLHCTLCFLPSILLLFTLSPSHSFPTLDLSPPLFFFA